MMVHIETYPLADAGEELIEQVRTTRWCWSLAHYEEYLKNLRWFMMNVPIHYEGLHIAHRHKHAEPCNEDCVLVMAELAKEAVTL